MTLKPIKQKMQIAVDNCIFSVIDGELHVLLIQMAKKPFVEMWALPGGLVNNKERLDTAAERILKEQTGVTQVYLEQLYTFDSLKRDPVGRIVSVAYISLISATGLKIKTSEKYNDVRWWKMSEVPKQMAYDHKEILNYAKQRLGWKVEYSNVAWSLLPEKFTLTELQQVYQAILGRELDKRNFRKRVLQLGLISPTGQQAMRGAHRPAVLYKFKERKPKIVQIL
ncbi:MAG: NUDIX domain-containing protein [Candidatus Uhrbacteria bacterium]